MKFSVLIPTRNHLDLLSYAIETVRRQDYSDWEIIVSDNFLFMIERLQVLMCTRKLTR